MALATSAAVGALLWFGCLGPTQVRLKVTTDRCANDPRIAINVGLTREALLEQYKLGEGTPAGGCVEGDSLGTLVFTPGAAGPNGLVYVTVRAAFDGKSPLDCLPDNNFAGCVIARRSFRYTSATPLELPVRILAECIDEPCTSEPGFTCSTGRKCVLEDTTCEADGTCVFADGGRELRSDASSRIDASTGDATTFDSGSQVTSGQCLAGDAVFCGVPAQNPPLCKINEGKACCAKQDKSGNGTCVPTGTCGPQATLFQQYCCTDSAQCGAPSSGKACCFHNENAAAGTIDVYRCRDLTPNGDGKPNCVGKAVLCGDGKGTCPAGMTCSPQPSIGPFFACK